MFDVLHKLEHIRNWWGLLDEYHSVVVCRVDFRLGGAWRCVGRGHRGDYVFCGVYREIDAPGRVVFTEIFEPFRMQNPSSPCELTEEDGKTRLTLIARYPSLEVRDMVIKTGMERGAAISWDKLEAVALALLG